MLRGVFGDFDESGSGSPERKSSIFSSFLLSLGGVFLPVGYTRSVVVREVVAICREILLASFVFVGDVFLRIFI